MRFPIVLVFVGELGTEGFLTQDSAFWLEKATCTDSYTLALVALEK
jgi:hypothetical protein